MAVATRQSTGINDPKSDAFKIESRNYFYGGNPSFGVQQCYGLVNKFVKE